MEDNILLQQPLANQAPSKQEDPQIFKAQRQTLKADYNVVNAIFRTRQECKYTICNKHVKDHQDEVSGHE
jgi:hypothetical protein